MMLVVVFGILGVVVGLAVDVVAVRVTSRDRPRTAAVPSPNGLGRLMRRLAWAETGAVTLTAPPIDRTWIRRGLLAWVTGASFSLAAARYDALADVLIVSAFIAFFLVCAITDILAYRVPNSVVVPAIACAIVVGIAHPNAAVVEVLLGGLIFGGILLVPVLLTGGAGMGMGDVKLALLAGLVLGIHHIAPALLLMAMSGFAVAAFLVLAGLRTRRDPIAYAPFISAGAIVTLLVHGSAAVRL